ncbi:hypothetical protein ACWEQV_18080 [Rhodococcus aetherivorans]|uniref:hypothetical protein n=1 Tax=Rhodococcus TaxID=1827 RepID=UPI0012605DF7|nr:MULTISPECIES: hypothetical protein [Rhodococcus]MDV6292841.1 hypothetical protein [Rhodococcus aetherivorans]NGP24562.1 hypothetical protein [Rhodococcus aetherivorans]
MTLNPAITPDTDRHNPSSPPDTQALHARPRTLPAVTAPRLTGRAGQQERCGWEPGRTSRAKVCDAEKMPTDPIVYPPANVIALAQHPRYQHADWTISERLVRRQELVLQHLGVCGDDGS